MNILQQAKDPTSKFSGSQKIEALGLILVAIFLVAVYLSIPLLLYWGATKVPSRPDQVPPHHEP